jgi:hypothetical protein
VNDMRELLSGALPAPQDEPPQRDVVDAAMDWGMRRRRRDWALSGAAALAVLAVGTGVAAMSGGSGNGVSPADGARSVAPTTASSPAFPPWGTSSCDMPGSKEGDLAQYCTLYEEQQNFNTDFAKGSVKYIQAALPAGYTVKATESWVLILTGPNGKTNYLFPTTEPASSLGGNPLSCGTPPGQNCVQTSTAGGTVVVNSGPSGDPSAGYVGTGSKDPRVDLLLGTSGTGGMNRMAPPTSATPLLTNAQLARILADPGFLGYAKTQLQHMEDVTRQLQNAAPPSSDESSFPSLPSQSGSGFPVGSPPSGASGSWSSPGGPHSSGSQPGGSQSSGGSLPSGGSQSSGHSQPSGSQSSPDGNSSSESSPGNPVSSGS